MEKFALLATLTCLGTADPVFCSEKGDSTKQGSFSLPCAQGNTYCGHTDTCCMSGCAPTTAICANPVGYCGNTDTINCDNLGKCCCTGLLDPMCTDLSSTCVDPNSGSGSGYVAPVVSVLVGLCIAFAVFMWCRRRHRYAGMLNRSPNYNINVPAPAATVITTYQAPVVQNPVAFAQPVASAQPVAQFAPPPHHFAPAPAPQQQFAAPPQQFAPAPGPPQQFAPALTPGGPQHFVPAPQQQFAPAPQQQAGPPQQFAQQQQPGPPQQFAQQPGPPQQFASAPAAGPPQQFPAAGAPPGY